MLILAQLVHAASAGRRGRDSPKSVSDRGIKADGQGGITRAATHAQGKVRDASDKVRDRVKTLRD